MADITITPIPPLTGVQGVSGAGQSLSGPPPSILASLPVGTTIAGFVLNRDAKGNPILRSEYGDFLLKSDLFLKIGSDVVVRIDSSARNFRASIISVDGKPPPPPESAAARGRDADVIVSSSARTPAQTPPAETPAAAPQFSRPPAATPVFALPPAPSPGALPQAEAENFPSPVKSEGAAPAAASARPPGLIVEATLLREQPGAARIFPDLPQHALTPGAALQFRLVSVQPPLSPARSTETLPPASTPSPLSTTTPVPGASLPPASAPLLAQQYGAYTRPAPDSAAPVAPAPSPATPLSAPIPLTATVLPAETPEAALPLLQTPLGTVRLNTPIILPEGTQARLELTAVATPSPPPSATASPAAASPPSAEAFLRGWPAMQTLLQALVTQTEPGEALPPLLQAFAGLQAGAPHLAASAPLGSRPPGAEHLENGMKFFLSALTGGNVQSLLGEGGAERLKQQGFTPLIRQAEGEFQLLRTMHADPPPHQWQPLFVPVLAEGEMKWLRFFSKRERGRGEKGRSAPADTRFVVELELSRLGEMQLDGFIKKREGAATQFDLVIRSHAPLSGEERADLLTLFSAVGEASGYRGTLLFQDVTEFPVHPMEEILAGSHHEWLA